ncbi:MULTISPECIES: CaiB/BaiF CoA transferase family protein [Clostridium]|uniref:E-cinnamoyl-CoA:R-phenyllactate CoA transferase n=2 Tax=Clostridium TaxID=1485 RepID=D8GUU0_CLOLD|nr:MULTISPECIES: CoA transferase [Clostridium]ADK16967.1 predicted acyl-CoA transferase [Clostridium ljungdahlii DSM 13528]AGY76007.1 CoA transferase [Clostridium autoethanogenum DSM 10061]ALU36170.1 Formyl-CoA transferase [Clostridium autoethanogenum DSM 10061]OAA85344.1 E-cinnamoyl-CoA:R-phenyllactate CoA transferase [Clostridium ljungdahlii DSM 13528]OVY51772.1 E-cinnamoyl-CoA:R-phenyllactate CoA transferase [Clostridium autoethanogenum]
MEPLKGIKVVDLTTYLAAPTTARIMGEWGADLIKIEAPKGDPARGQGSVFNMPFSDEENLPFDVANMDKRFITINLKTEHGREVAYKLLEEADVFITNTRTKSLVKLGMDYDTLKEKFPKLIFAQVLGYGEKGPAKDRPGFDATCYMARGGVLGTTVDKGGSPMNPPNGYGDFQVSICLLSGICGALFNRERTGKGDKITVSLQHAASFMLSVAMISAQYGNEYPKSRKEVPNPFNNCYRTKDNKWVVMCCPEYDRDYDKIMNLLDVKHMVGNKKYNNCAKINSDKLNHEVVDILDEAISKINRDDLLKILEDNELPCEAANEPLDVYKDEQVWANNILTKVDYPSGKRMVPTNPILFGSMSEPIIKTCKPQGAHTEQIMKELGYSSSEVEEYINEGAVAGLKLLKK